MYSKSKNIAKGVLPKGFKADKCKTALKLAIARMNLMKNKRENQAKGLRRELAQLLESGQDRTALIRVEHIIREEKTLSAYELINLYCELIVTRLPIIESQKNCPLDLKEAIASVVFASPRCADIVELADVKKHFVAKYGKEFVNSALELRPECGVSSMLVEKLSVRAPDAGTKLKVLTSIAEEHNIKWSPKSLDNELQQPKDDLLNGPQSLSSSSQIPKESSSVYSHVRADSIPIGFKASQSSDAPPSSSGSYAHINSRTSDIRQSGSHLGGVDYADDLPSFSENVPFAKKKMNMEFKDAASAAQAAAESAERASFAARAAVELASQGNHPYDARNETEGWIDPRMKGQNAPEQFIAMDNFRQGNREDNKLKMQNLSDGGLDHFSSNRKAGSTHDGDGNISRSSSGKSSNYNWPGTRKNVNSGRGGQKSFSKEDSMERNDWANRNEYAEDKTSGSFSKLVSSPPKSSISRSSSNASSDSGRAFRDARGGDHNFSGQKIFSKEVSLEGNYKGYKNDDAEFGHGRAGEGFRKLGSSSPGGTSFNDSLWRSDTHGLETDRTHLAATYGHQDNSEGTSGAVFDGSESDADEPSLFPEFNQGNLLDPSPVHHAEPLVFMSMKEPSILVCHGIEPLVDDKSSQRHVQLEPLQAKYFESVTEETIPSQPFDNPPVAFDDSDGFSSGDEDVLAGSLHKKSTAMNTSLHKESSLKDPLSPSAIGRKLSDLRFNEKEVMDVSGDLAAEHKLADDKVWGRSDSGGSIGSRSSSRGGAVSSGGRAYIAEEGIPKQKGSFKVSSPEESKYNLGIDSGDPSHDDRTDGFNYERQNRGFPRPPYVKIPVGRDEAPSKRGSAGSFTEEAVAASGPGYQTRGDNLRGSSRGEAHEIEFDGGASGVGPSIASGKKTVTDDASPRYPEGKLESFELSDHEPYRKPQHPKLANESPSTYLDSEDAAGLAEPISPKPSRGGKDIKFSRRTRNNPRSDAERARPSAPIGRPDAPNETEPKREDPPPPQARSAFDPPPGIISWKTRKETGDDDKNSFRSNPLPEQQSSPVSRDPPEKPSQSDSSQPVTPRVEASRGSHIHPKLPDYDSFAAHFQSLKANRRS